MTEESTPNADSGERSANHKVIRYAPVGVGHFAYMGEHAEGAYVRLTDYERLERELAEARRLLADADPKRACLDRFVVDPREWRMARDEWMQRKAVNGSEERTEEGK